MPWYTRYKKDNMEKIARKFRLGTEIEKEIDSYLHKIIPEIIFGGLPKAIKKPNNPLSTEPFLMSLPMDEFKKINRISDKIFPDEININVIPELCYVTNEKDTKINAFYYPGANTIKFKIYFSENDLKSRLSFFSKVKDSLEISSRHELLHFIRDKGRFQGKNKKYISPSEDIHKYKYQYVEFENYMSDFHNWILSDIYRLVNGIASPIDFIFAIHNAPDSNRKKKALSRIYKTIQEMDSIYGGKEHEEIAMALKGVLLAALNNDISLLNNRMDKVQDMLEYYNL